MEPKNIIPPSSGPSTKLAPNQINLRALFSVEAILKSRGYQIKKKGSLTDLLIPTVKFGSKDYEMLLESFNDKNCRKEIQEYIKNDKKSLNEKTLRIISHPDFVKIEQVFTKTFEWYIGEAMVRFFQGFSFAFGVDFSNVLHNQTGNQAGDYDTLVVGRNLGLLYFECKTGSFKHTDIQKSIDRAISLNCESVIIITFSLVEQHLIDIILKTQHPLINSPNPLSKIKIKSNPEGAVYEWHNCYFISASKDFIEQMKTILRFNEAKRIFMQYSMRPNKDELSKMGYEEERL